jgi:hypothetical protein
VKVRLRFVLLALVAALVLTPVEDEEADTPAPRVTVLAAAEEGEGAAPTTTEEAGGAAAEAAPAEGGDDDDNSGLAMGFGIAGLVAGLVALGVALFRGNRRAAT